MNAREVKLDSKGRAIIPNSFREALGIKTGENLVIELDKSNERLILFPIQKKETKKIEIWIGDKPGSLAKAAGILSRNKADLIFTESRSLSREKEAVWSVVADFSKTDLKKLKGDLSRDKAVKKFKLTELK